MMNDKLPHVPTRSTAIALALMLTSGSFFITGCGGGSSSTSTNTPSPFSGTYLTVSLSSGVYSPSSTRSLATPSLVGTSRTALTDPPDTITFQRLSNGSYLAITEITRYQWTLVMGTTPWSIVPSSLQGTATDSRLPANNLSRDDAVSFASAVAARCSLAVRVPAMVDYQAAYGGAGHDFPWTSGVAGVAYSTVRESNSSGPTAVSTYDEVRGFYDLIGNVREWTTGGQLVGGGWLDNLNVSGLNKPMLTVDPDVRHPLAGLRLIVRN